MFDIVTTLYLVGLVMTLIYVIIQLSRTLPEDLDRFKEYQKKGLIGEDEDIEQFFLEVVILSGLAIVFWFLFIPYEIKRLRGSTR